MSDNDRTSTIGAEAPTEGAEVLQFPRTRERRRFSLRFWRRRKRPKRFKVRKAGRALNVNVKLTRSGRALVQRRHRVRAEATVTSRKVGTKSTKRTTRTLTIRAR